MTIHDEELIEAVLKASSVSGVLKILKKAKVGSNHVLVKEGIERLGLDTSHWRASPVKLDIKTAFSRNGRHSRQDLKKLILREKLIPYKCALCDLEPTWKGRPLTLVLDHENGVRDDDRLSNLRFLCPNCNSQTETFCGRNKKKREVKYRICIDCGGKTVSVRCKSCSLKNYHRKQPQATKIDWPDIETLEQKIASSKSLSAVARELGVSDNAVRKRLKNHRSKRGKVK